MNKWIRRTAGTVGIAGGALLLGTAAHADTPVHDLADTASIDGGLSGVGVSLDTPGQRDTVGLLPDGGGPVRSGTNNGELGAVVHAPTQDGQPRDVFANGRTPDIFQALPITDVVPMDGLGMPTARTLPAPARESTGLPVRNLPIGTSMAGDTLRGGDYLARDGFAGNGLGIPLGDQLPLGAAQNLATQSQSLGGGSALPLGGGGGLPLIGGSSRDASGGGFSRDASGGRAQTTPTAGQQQTARSQGSPILAGDAVHVLPPSESFVGRHRAEAGLPTGGLPTAGGLPVVGGVLQGGTLPTKANVNTLPGAPALPVHNLLAPGTAATGASAGNALNQASGTVNNLAAQGGGTESLPVGSLPVGSLPVGGGALPVGDEALPVVGGLTGPTGTRGMPLPDTRGIPVVGGVADGLTGGKHRAQYMARHSA
ncbi:hypothetical protein GCM10009557_08230 [Virgisporangium ochraceum]